MKVLFEDSENETSLFIGIEVNNNLQFGVFTKEKDSWDIVEVDLNEAYKLQRQLSEFIREIEEAERKKLPWHKRLF